MSGYCILDDVYLLGLSAQAFVSRPRPFDSVDASTATVRLKAHGFAVDDILTFEVTDGGTLPTAISGFVPYYAVPSTSDLFRLATLAGGSPIASWVTAGDGWGISLDPARRILSHIVETASEIDENLTAHLPPILVDPITHKFPQVLIGLNARMAARAAVLSLQIENPGYRVAVDRLFAREADDRIMLAAWKAGKPIQPRPTDENSIADNSARAYSDTATDWRGTCGGRRSESF